MITRVCTVLLLAALSMAAGPSPPAFDFVCDATARRIEGALLDQKTYSTITVWNAACSAGTCTPSATPVFLGGEYNPKTGVVIDAVTNAKGMPICSTTGCIGGFATYEVQNLQCIAASEVHVTVQVIR